MSSKAHPGYSLKLTGPGVSFDRAISEEIATSIINLVMTGTMAAAVAPNGGAAGIPANAGHSVQPPTQLSSLSIKQFIAQKRPDNSYQRVACLAYYLTHALDSSHFKTKDITKANTDAAGPKFSNTAVFVNDATTKYRYLSPAGGGNKQITTFGEQIVEALPDQEKIKQLHADNKRRGQRKTKRKSK